MGHIGFISSLLMASLFAIAIVTFAINFAGDNGSSISLGDDSEFNSYSDQVEGNLTQFYNDVNSSSNTLFESTLNPGDENTATGGQFKSNQGSTTKLLYSSLKVGYTKIFGNDTGFAYIFTSFLGLLIYIGVALIYKAWIGRNPE